MAEKQVVMAMEISSYIACSILVILYLYTLRKVCVGQQTISFLFYLVILLILSNVAEISYTIMLSSNRFDKCFEILDVRC